MSFSANIVLSYFLVWVSCSVCLVFSSLWAITFLISVTAGLFLLVYLLRFTTTSFSILASGFNSTSKILLEPSLMVSLLYPMNEMTIFLPCVAAMLNSPLSLVIVPCPVPTTPTAA